MYDVVLPPMHKRIYAALMKSESIDRINWFTIENGETEYADLLAKHLDIKINKLTYDMDES
jgi:hypothetical protein